MNKNLHPNSIRQAPYFAAITLSDIRFTPSNCETALTLQKKYTKPNSCRLYTANASNYKLFFSYFGKVGSHVFQQFPGLRSLQAPALGISLPVNNAGSDAVCSLDFLVISPNLPFYGGHMVLETLNSINKHMCS